MNRQQPVDCPFKQIYKNQSASPRGSSLIIEPRSLFCSRYRSALFHSTGAAWQFLHARTGKWILQARYGKRDPWLALGMIFCEQWWKSARISRDRALESPLMVYPPTSPYIYFRTVSQSSMSGKPQSFMTWNSLQGEITSWVQCTNANTECNWVIWMVDLQCGKSNFAQFSFWQG